MSKTIAAATEVGRKDLATKTDLAQLEARLETKFAALETKFAAAINKMALSQIAVAGVLFAALKLF